VDPVAKRLPQFVQAFARALTGGIIAKPDKCRITRIIPVRNCIIVMPCLFNESIQQVILTQWVPQPKKPAMKSYEQPQKGIRQAAKLVIVATGLFGRAGIVDVAHYRDPDGL